MPAVNELDNGHAHLAPQHHTAQTWRARVRAVTLRERLWAVALCAGVAAGTGVALAAADGTFSSATPDSHFNPVVLSTTIANPLHVGTKVSIKVVVAAAAGVLDLRSATVGVISKQSELRVEVKLAPKCGGEFAYTSGLTLVNRLLAPQPAAGRSYTGTVTNDSATPTSTGTDLVCVWLVDQEQQIQRTFASDQSQSVVVQNALAKKRGSYGGST